MNSPSFSRRRFLQATVGLTLAGASGFAYARTIEPRWVDVERVTLTLPGLAQHLHGKRVVQISDLHLSPYFTAEKLIHVVAHINRLAPDWVFLTGDYYAGSEYGEQLIEPLRELDPPTFAIFGNHDVGGWRSYTRRYLAETRVKLLSNAGLLLEPGLWLAGVDDVWRGSADLRAALRDKPAVATTILLAHEPDYFDEVIRQDAPVGVQLSGHTHGGQIRVPTLEATPNGKATRALVLPFGGQRYEMGLYARDARQLYVNRGIGAWPLPYRINCRPEITLFTLAAG
ncbi:MAG: metallophosphoesterase [Caldilineaceae bacterium]|nr:metallophosphoesterase [Caldilineaceae bacterium]